MMLWWAVAAAGPLDVGLPNLATKELSAYVEEHDLPFVHARLGSAWARTGRYADAVASFELGAGAPFHLREGFLDHATALRSLGRCEEAASVRLEGRWDVEESVELLLLSEAVADHAACGHWEQAEEVALQGLALDPDAPAVNAAWAEVLRATGDDVGAEHHLELALSAAAERRALRPWLVAAEVRLDAGDRIGAADALDHAMELTFRHPTMIWLRVRLLVGAEAWADAATLLRQMPWAVHEDRRLLAAKVAVLAHQGDASGAREAHDRSLELYGVVDALPEAAGSLAGGDGRGSMR
jgi:tetratricopeptide (TPR) repeat protein